MSSSNSKLYSLQNILQNYLISDSAAFQNLPFILSVLSAGSFAPSYSITRWSARIDTLLCSEKISIRWAGVCIALRSANLSKKFMVDYASSWVTNTIPMLSLNNNAPQLIKGALKLLTLIFTATSDIPEFQRQIVIPNIPKCSTAICALLHKATDYSLQIAIIDSLTILISSYPNLHRYNDSIITTYTLRMLDGSPSMPLDSVILEKVAQLHVTLLAISGKLQAASRWRANVDDSIKYCRSSLTSFRAVFSTQNFTVFVDNTQVPAISAFSAFSSIDRLRCGVVLLTSFLCVQISRPVAIPLGPVISLCFDMLQCDFDLRVEEQLDNRTHQEAAIYSFACSLINALADRCGCHLMPYLSRILSMIALHLEQPLSDSNRIHMVQLASKLLTQTYPLSTSYIPNRLLKSILPFLSVLSSPNVYSKVNQPEEKTTKRDEKRPRTYGDDFFQIIDVCLFEKEELALASLDAVKCLMQEQNIAQHLRASTSKLLLSVILTIVAVPSTLISLDRSVKEAMLCKVRSILVFLMMKSTRNNPITWPFVIDDVMHTASMETKYDSLEYNQHLVELLLHPFLPPVLHTFQCADKVGSISITEEHFVLTSGENVGDREDYRSSEKPEDINVAAVNKHTLIDQTKQSSTAYMGQSVLVDKKTKEQSLLDSSGSMTQTTQIPNITEHSLLSSVDSLFPTYQEETLQTQVNKSGSIPTSNLSLKLVKEKEMTDQGSFPIHQYDEVNVTSLIDFNKTQRDSDLTSDEEGIPKLTIDSDTDSDVDP